MPESASGSRSGVNGAVLGRRLARCEWTGVAVLDAWAGNGAVGW
jgi:hypothetical protein